MSTNTGPRTDVTIHRAGPDDAETVMQMVREIAAHEDQLQHLSVTTERWAQVLDRPDVIVLVARRDGAAVGYVSTCGATRTSWRSTTSTSASGPVTTGSAAG